MANLESGNDEDELIEIREELEDGTIVQTGRFITRGELNRIVGERREEEERERERKATWERDQ